MKNFCCEKGTFLLPLRNSIKKNSNKTNEKEVCENWNRPNLFLSLDNLLIIGTQQKNLSLTKMCGEDLENTH